MSAHEDETISEAMDRLHGEMLAIAEAQPEPFRTQEIEAVNAYCEATKDSYSRMSIAALMAALEETK